MGRGQRPGEHATIARGPRHARSRTLGNDSPITGERG